MKNSETQDLKAFELIAGHAALDLVNTLDERFSPDGPHERLVTYEDLLRFVLQSQLLTERQAKKLRRSDASPAARAEIVRQVKELREALAQIIYSQLEAKEVSDEALALLEEHFRQAASHRRLSIDNLQITWTWRGLGSQSAAPLWLLAQAAEELVLSGHATHLRCCSADTCRWLFLDTSKNQTRRWCDMKICGNRMKARRFNARQATG